MESILVMLSAALANVLRVAQRPDSGTVNSRTAGELRLFPLVPQYEAAQATEEEHRLKFRHGHPLPISRIMRAA